MAVVYTKLMPTTSYRISLPFNISSNNRINMAVETDPKVWRDKVITLLSTGVNQRIWYYYYGANLDELLFENYQEAYDEGAERIRAMFVTWLPDLRFGGVKASFDSATGILQFNITYILPNGEPDSVIVSTASLTAAGELIEGA